MGVSSTVHVCVRADGPLDAERRAQIVEVCLEHRLLSGLCVFATPVSRAALSVPAVGPWRRLVDTVQGVSALFGGAKRRRTPALASREQGPFVRQALAAHRGLEGDALRIVERREAGPWLTGLARRTLGAFAVGSPVPEWDGEAQDGGFTYLAMPEAFAVTVDDAYSAPEAQRGPHSPPDGFVGLFCDVLTLSARRAGDGRAMSRSAFVRALKSRVGLKVTCRASWW